MNCGHCGALAHDPCPSCGQIVHVGDFPFCPHGRSTMNIAGDDVPGGFVAENGFDMPQVFYSKKAHRDALAARGLTIAAKWAGPQDQHLKRWDTPCQKTLENAAVLLTRGVEATQSRRAELAAVTAEFPITVTPCEVRA